MKIFRFFFIIFSLSMLICSCTSGDDSSTAGSGVKSKSSAKYNEKISENLYRKLMEQEPISDEEISVMLDQMKAIWLDYRDQIEQAIANNEDPNPIADKIRSSVRWEYQDQFDEWIEKLYEADLLNPELKQKMESIYKEMDALDGRLTRMLDEYRETNHNDYGYGNQTDSGYTSVEKTERTTAKDTSYYLRSMDRLLEISNRMAKLAEDYKNNPQRLLHSSEFMEYRNEYDNLYSELNDAYLYDEAYDRWNLIQDSLRSIQTRWDDRLAGGNQAPSSQDINLAK